MASISKSTRLHDKLKAIPDLYKSLRFLWRSAKAGWVELWRLIGTGMRVGGPQDFYSGLDALRRGRCEGAIILEGQALPALPKESLIQRASMDQNGRQPWPIFWLRQPQARLVGESLAPLDRSKRLMIEAVYGKEFCRRDPSFNYTFLPPAKKLDGAWTSLISMWSNNYYHWFLDALPRLAVMHDFPKGVKILVHGPMKRYQMESLEMLGLSGRVREAREKHLVVEDYYFSSPVGMSGCTNPYAVNWLREMILPKQAILATPRRFFINRVGKTRGIINQREITNHLTTQGWAIVDMEKLSLAEQIAHFANAEAVIGEHGAGFTNLLWCKPECRVLELCSDNYLNGCYEGISQVNGLQYRFEIFRGVTSGGFIVSRDAIDNFLSTGI